MAALQDNAAVLADRLAPARLKCVVKANAYGHGVDIVAPVLFTAGWREFCVATIPEALHLRSLLGPEHVIIRMALRTHHRPRRGGRAEIELGVSTVESLDRLRDAARRTNATARLHLKIDTGLGRNGLAPADSSVPLLVKLKTLERGPNRTTPTRVRPPRRSESSES